MISNPTLQRTLPALFALIATALAQTRTLDLWPPGTPQAEVKAPEDRATLEMLEPPGSKEDAPPRVAVLLTPGGGYKHHSSHGAFSPFLHARGVVVFYLKYRLPVRGYRHPAPMEDAQRAMRTIRANAKEWNIDPERVGVLGFSSGGHVAATLSTNFYAGYAGARDPIARAGCRPDFAILFSPVITMKEGAHTPSVKRLLGDSPPAKLLDLLSCEQQVKEDTPPTFIAHARDDTLVLPVNSELYHAALVEKKVPAQLHLYPTGGHGGIQRENPEWEKELEDWLVKTAGVTRKADPAK